LLFEKYRTQDFVIALRKLEETHLNLDYDLLVHVAKGIITPELIEDLQQFDFEDSVLAAFGNGLVIGVLVAEGKYKPKEPLIKH
jgi:hypothetical protein